MNRGKMRIETSGSPLPRDWKLYLDGVDISRHVRAISFRAGVGTTCVVALELVVTPEFDQEFSAKIELEKYDPLGLFPKSESKEALA